MRIVLFKDKYVPAEAVCFLFFLITSGVAVFYWWNGFETYSFGFEYGNIAYAWATGKGYADVFGAGTGPTSWCPPFPTLIQFLVFKIFGAKSQASFWAIHTLQAGVLTVALYLLLKINYNRIWEEYKILIVPIFLVYSLIVLSRDFDDTSLNILLSIATVYVFTGIHERGVDDYRWGLYLLAVILPLANISLFLGFGMLLALNLFYGIRRKRFFIPLAHTFLLLAVMGTTTFLWGFRNQTALGKFIPFKSNLWFEVYMSNVKDEDGIIGYSNWYLYHPMTNKHALDHYKSTGEIEFLESYKKPSLEYLSAHPMNYVVKVLNRCKNVFVFTASAQNIEMASVQNFDPEDIRKLESRELLLDGNWMCLDMSREKFEQTVGELMLKQPFPVNEDWVEKRKALSNRLYSSPQFLAGGLLLCLLPSLALVLSLFKKDVRNNMVFRCTVFFFFLSVTPYILFSHYARYQIFQAGFFTMLIFLFLASALDQIRRRTGYKILIVK